MSDNHSLELMQKLVDGFIKEDRNIRIHFYTTNQNNYICIFDNQIIKSSVYYVIFKDTGDVIYFSSNYFRLLNLVKRGKMKFEKGRFISLE